MVTNAGRKRRASLGLHVGRLREIYSATFYALHKEMTDNPLETFPRGWLISKFSDQLWHGSFHKRWACLQFIAYQVRLSDRKLHVLEALVFVIVRWRMRRNENVWLSLSIENRPVRFNYFDGLFPLDKIVFVSTRKKQLEISNNRVSFEDLLAPES